MNREHPSLQPGLQERTRRFVDERYASFVDAALTAAGLSRLALDDVPRVIALGAASLSEGRLDHARRLFRLAANLEPELYAPYYHLGIIEVRAKRFEEAAAAYQRARVLLEKEPRRTTEQQAVLHEVAFGLAGVMLRLGRAREAASCLADLRAIRDRLAPGLARRIDACLHELGVAGD